MKRTAQHALNRATIERLAKMIRPELGGRALPSYRMAVASLNAEGYRTSMGRLWTCRALYRMLQREGFSGLHGLRDRAFSDHYTRANTGISTHVRDMDLAQPEKVGFPSIKKGGRYPRITPSPPRHDYGKNS